MRAARAAIAFARAPARQRLLALEAAAELARARIMTLLPARIYTTDLGRLVAGEADAGPGAPDAAPDDATTRRAAEIGRMVEAVARAMPFRAVCLQQAIAVKRMLARRDLAATVYLGVSRDAADRAVPSRGTAAHAWVTVGPTVINGDQDLARFTIVARFG